MTASALIADDEPLLRQRLVAHLARLWPELQIVAEARNGREAVELFEAHAPQIVFLDVQMPGLNGVDAARAMAGRTQIVFVTAYAMASGRSLLVMTTVGKPTVLTGSVWPLNVLAGMVAGV